MSGTFLNTLHRNLEFLRNRKGLRMDIGGVIDGKEQLTVEQLLLISEEHNLSIESLLYTDIEQREKFRTGKIKMLVMDCDGVLTDGVMYFTESGDEIKRFNAKDGQGIRKLHEKGIITGIISAGVNKKIIEHRGSMLGTRHIYVGKEPKWNILKSWLNELSLKPEEIAYIGDDLTDIPVLNSVGFSACPSDAATDVLSAVDLVLQKKGGEGCVRELAENYLL